MIRRMLFAAMCAATIPAGAQETADRACWTGRPAVPVEGAETVTVRILSADAAISVAQGGAILRSLDASGEPSCAGSVSRVVDGFGEIVIAGVPPGMFTLIVYGQAFSSASPTIQVEEGKGALIDLPVFREDLLRDCIGDDRCSGFLSMRNQDPDSETPRVVAYRAALALAFITDESGEESVYCLEDANQEELRALQGPNAEIVPLSDCAMSDESFEARLVHLSTGRSARRLSVDSVTPTEDGRWELDVSYFFHGLGAAGFRCDLEQRGAAKLITFCRRTWIS